MSGMTAVHAAEMLRAFTAQVGEGARPTTVWRWVNGTVLFPEAMCPRCRTPMRSVDRIWMVDVGGKRLKGQMVLRRRRPGGKGPLVWRLESERFDHLHCRRGGNGSICMGNSTDPVAVLFGGMYQEGAYRTSDAYWRRWLAKMFDHRCDETAVRRVRDGTTGATGLRL